MTSKTRARSAIAGRAALIARAQPQPVWFEYRDGAARAVSIAWSFSNREMSSTRMAYAGRGRWVRLLFLPPGRYEYLFLVDGRCVADPRATESVPNAFGCVNSVLSVPVRAPTNGCARRMIGRAPAPPPQSSAKSGTRLRRKASLRVTRTRFEPPRLKTIAQPFDSNFLRRQTTQNRNQKTQMKRTLLRPLAVLTVLLVGLALTGCGSGDSHEHGAADQKTPDHQHSH